MKNKSTRKLFNSVFTESIIILAASFVLAYLIISLYFMNHFFFNTVINGTDVSLKAHGDAGGIIKRYVQDYRLQLIERNGDLEEIIGQDIGMQYNGKNSIPRIYKVQSPLKWPSSLLKEQNYYVPDMFAYNAEDLENRISKLNCLNKDVVMPRNVSFKYIDGCYETSKEVYGNKIHEDKLYKAIEMSVLKGQIKLDLDENSCYENPKYILSSEKASKTKNLLNKYVSAKITYLLRNRREVLDKSVINQWLSVDEDLEAVIDEKAVKDYVQGLGKKYDTVGKSRKIKTSTNRIIEVKGGYYGWKINLAAETQALLENIKRGEVLEKEPIYIQKALSEDENDIGDTYVEINITRQYLWFYKDGRLITQGAIVTGNPNRGNATKVGVYMLNYKQKGPTLRGPGYEADVIYWMPFNGDIGIHDASWRYSFGGNIYKRNGSHGCVNVSLYLAKKIFNNIEDGTPVICYEE